ncbi:hypothetical protein R3P38DRAFT_3177308 [Favolaschia claudopus]|uniref:Uncharacterized protein n=1 Tax=Favolaschia claudopus TaxID=2862362 RepID=A0AAW0CZ01_9AGAR
MRRRFGRNCPSTGNVSNVTCDIVTFPLITPHRPALPALGGRLSRTLLTSLDTTTTFCVGASAGSLVHPATRSFQARCPGYPCSLVRPPTHSLSPSYLLVCSVTDALRPVWRVHGSHQRPSHLRSLGAALDAFFYPPVELNPAPLCPCVFTSPHRLSLTLAPAAPSHPAALIRPIPCSCVCTTPPPLIDPHALVAPPRIRPFAHRPLAPRLVLYTTTHALACAAPRRVTQPALNALAQLALPPSRSLVRFSILPPTHTRSSSPLPPRSLDRPPPPSPRSVRRPSFVSTPSPCLIRATTRPAFHRVADTVCRVPSAVSPHFRPPRRMYTQAAVVVPPHTPRSQCNPHRLPPPFTAAIPTRCRALTHRSYSIATTHPLIPAYVVAIAVPIPIPTTPPLSLPRHPFPLPRRIAISPITPPPAQAIGYAGAVSRAPPYTRTGIRVRHNPRRAAVTRPPSAVLTPASTLFTCIYCLALISAPPPAVRVPRSGRLIPYI